jgi:hypothetical protein
MEHRCAELGCCLRPTQAVEVSHHSADNTVRALVLHRQRRLHAQAHSTRCLAEEGGKAGQQVRSLLVMPGYDGAMSMQSGQIQSPRMKAVAPFEYALP